MFFRSIPKNTFKVKVFSLIRGNCFIYFKNITNTFMFLNHFDFLITYLFSLCTICYLIILRVVIHVLRNKIEQKTEVLNKIIK